MFGAFKKQRPFKRCDLTAYHGTYAARMGSIVKKGLTPGRKGEVWLARSAKAAAAHAARKAAEEGCPQEPIALVKVRVVGSATECPVYRPTHRFGVALYMTTSPIPASRILEVVLPDPKAVAEGHARARRGKRFRKSGAVCPPPPGKFYHRKA
jgi:hypothetical protein